LLLWVVKFRISGTKESKLLEHGRGLNPHDTCGSSKVVFIAS
jgi:hypothetical protein